MAECFKGFFSIERSFNSGLVERKRQKESLRIEHCMEFNDTISEYVNVVREGELVDLVCMVGH